MAGLSHTCRLRPFAKERTYSLQSGAVCWHEGNRSGLISLSEIEKVNLKSFVGKAGPQGLCVLRSRSGKALPICSHHFLEMGFGDLENRSRSYEPFVRALCKGIHEANPHAIFCVGSIQTQVLLTAFLVLFVLFLVYYFGFASSEESLMVSITLFSFSLIVFAYFVNGIRKNKEKKFDPKKPPNNMIIFY